VGVVALKAKVLIYYALQLQHRGLPVLEAVARAGQRRLRPILMTTSTTVFGLLPLALGIGEGAELQAPLARAIVGGLVTSMLASLFLIPAFYVVLDRAVQWARARRPVPPGAVEPTQGK